MKLNPSIIEHWHSQYDDLQLSSTDFYDTLTAVLRERQLPKVRYKPVILYEGGIFSRRREYFAIEKGNLQFIVCAAPFGRSFFFSWYMKEYSGVADVLGGIPLVGNWLRRLFTAKVTLYKYDTIILFRESIKHVVREVLAEIEKTKGVRAISTQTAQPYFTDAPLA